MQQPTPEPKGPELRVVGNKARLVPPDSAIPPTQATTAGATNLAVPAAAPAPYWTADKAAKFLAQGAKSLSKLYGPDMRLSEVEIDLLGPPAAAVMNDWMPVAPGADGDKQANLIYLVVVVGMLVLFRLPDILEAHDMLPAWAANRAKKPAERPRDQVAQERAAPSTVTEAEPAHVPSPSGADRWNMYQDRLVGGGDRFTQPLPA